MGTGIAAVRCADRIHRRTSGRHGEQRRSVKRGALRCARVNENAVPSRHVGVVSEGGRGMRSAGSCRPATPRANAAFAGAVQTLNRVNINSADHICSIFLERNRDARDHPGFRMAARVDIGHGYFEASNGDVRFSNLREFVAELDHFILDRRRVPRLDGTYDSSISFVANGNSVILRYCIGDAFHGQKTALFHQSGTFEVDQEKLFQYLAELKALL